MISWPISPPTIAQTGLSSEPKLLSKVLQNIDEMQIKGRERQAQR
jgi:hypothetical protein